MEITEVVVEQDKRTYRPAPLDEFEDLPDGGGIDISQYVSILGKRWRLLLLSALSGGLIAGAVSLAIPNMYTASALILPPTKPQSLSSALMGQFGGMAGAVAPGLGLKDPNELYIGILRSRTTTDEIAKQFALQKVYSKMTAEDTRAQLLARATFASGRDSMIRISVQDNDPKRAADLANGYVKVLNSQDSRIAISESSQRRMFFEREVEAEKNALAAAESRLKETQQRTGVVEVNTQAQLLLSSVMRIRSEIAMKEVALQRLSMGATAENPEVARQQAELSALRAESARLEAGTSRQRAGDPMVPMANVPQAGLDYLRAVRDVKYHDSLFEVLSKQFEAARIDEAKESPVIQVVDPAIPPEKKSGPHRTTITLVGALVSALAAGAFVLSSGKSSERPA